MTSGIEKVVAPQDVLGGDAMTGIIVETRKKETQMEKCLSGDSLDERE